MAGKFNPSQNVDVRKAVSAARNYIQSLEGEIGAPIKDLLLEETELTDDRKFWLITLGFSRQMSTSNYCTHVAVGYI